MKRKIEPCGALPYRGDGSGDCVRPAGHRGFHRTNLGTSFLRPVPARFTTPRSRGEAALRAQAKYRKMRKLLKGADLSFITSTRHGNLVELVVELQRIAGLR